MPLGEICNREVVIAEKSRLVTAAARWSGILTLDDLLALLAQELGELARLVSHARQREAATRA